jgi:DNA-binding transcriptional LysR family regulator
MVALTAASKQCSNLEAACRAAGFAPQIVAETSDLGVTIELIHQQIGAAVLPRSALAGAAKVTQLSLTRPKLDRRILLAWHPSNSTPAARALLALAAGCCQRECGGVGWGRAPEAGERDYRWRRAAGGSSPA